MKVPVAHGTHSSGGRGRLMCAERSLDSHRGRQSLVGFSRPELHTPFFRCWGINSVNSTLKRERYTTLPLYVAVQRKSMGRTHLSRRRDLSTSAPSIWMFIPSGIPGKCASAIIAPRGSTTIRSVLLYGPGHNNNLNKNI